MQESVFAAIEPQVADIVETEPSEADSEVFGIENLAVGQVIVARIPTIEDGNVMLYDRDCIVLGFEAKPKQDGATGIYLARLAFNRAKFTAEYGHVVEREEFAASGILGIGSSFVLRTDRVDLLPLDRFFFGRRIRTVGLVNSSDTMLAFGDAILKGLVSGNGEAGRGPRARLEGSEARQTLQAGAQPAFAGLPLARIAREMTKLKRAGTDDYERALYQVQLIRRHAVDKARRKFVLAAMAAQPTEPLPAVEPAKPFVRLEYVSRAEIMRRKKRMSTTRADRIVTRINESVRRNREEAGLEQPRDPGHIKGNALAASEPKRTRASRTPADLSSARPLFSIADNYVPILPKGVKRGDVLVLKIADILDPKDKRPAQRPCVVWNVYENAETGEICGFDVFPRTRLRAHEFEGDYTAEFPNLYNNRIWDGGRIVTQMIARVEVGPQHFHPLTKRVRTLNPALVQELVEKHEACKAAGRTMTPYGVKQMPETWRLREAPLEEPSASQRAHAEHIHDHLERHAAALQTAPNVGEIVMRKVRQGNDIVEVPTLIWGVWYNTVTKLPAAFECVRIDLEDKMTRAWRAGLPITTADGEALAADMASVDLVRNTEKFFTAGEAVVIARLGEDEMNALSDIRADALIRSKDRKGTYPEFLPFDWVREDGPSYGFSLDALKSRKFAPDLGACRDPGYLRHQGGRRTDNRRGMIPRRKQEGFKKMGRAPV